MLHQTKTRTASLALPPPHLYGTLWRWHFLAALIVIPFVLWQSVTGTLYLWSERWMDLSYPHLRFVKTSGQHSSPSEQVAAALRSAPQLAGGVVPPAHHHGDVPIADDTTSLGETNAASQQMPIQEILISDDPARSTIVLLAGANGLPYAVFVNPHDATVLGALAGGDWLPGLTRALHGGWPLGKPGSWLLELGDGWAIFMILSGVYLWWPRGRSLCESLWPRFGLGLRVALRDLHASVAMLFAAVFLFFLVSALPWTAFWGQELLPRMQILFGQASPFGFSPGGASARQLSTKLPALDELVAGARIRRVRGTLEVSLAPWPDAPFNITNRDNSPSDDRTIIGDSGTGRLIGDYSPGDLSIVPRLVALGVHVHQGDFGPVNVWLNTAFALSLVWLSATGLASWWVRRPKGHLGVPKKHSVAWRWPLTTSALALCVVLPIFGASVIAVSAINKLMRLNRL
jgi:uncharacterized iron-regulated membrane protein